MTTEKEKGLMSSDEQERGLLQDIQSCESQIERQLQDILKHPILPVYYKEKLRAILLSNWRYTK